MSRQVTDRMLALLLRIPEVPGSNLGPEIRYSDSPSSIPRAIRENSGVGP
jgi:hypothetical protein